MPRRSIHFACGFSLIELLVVIGIIAVLIGILLPTMARVRQQSKQVACMSNMRQVGQLLLMYANANDGWIYPIGPEEQPRLGVFVPEDQRWPVYVKGLERWKHPLLLCGQDDDPVEGHSYALSWYLQQHGIRFHNQDIGGRKPGEVILMGEKRARSNHYFIGNDNDYESAADPYKHGLRLGSNYLFLDLHVSTLPAKDARAGYDPWNATAGQ